MINNSFIKDGVITKFPFYCRAKKGYMDVGWFEIVGDAIKVNNTFWTPIVFHTDEDPTFFKTDAIEISDEREYYNVIN